MGSSSQRDENLELTPTHSLTLEEEKAEAFERGMKRLGLGLQSHRIHHM
jgi:hypothetical protein